MYLLTDKMCFLFFFCLQVISLDLDDIYLSALKVIALQQKPMDTVVGFKLCHMTNEPFTQYMIRYSVIHRWYSHREEYRCCLRWPPPAEGWPERETRRIVKLPSFLFTDRRWKVWNHDLLFSGFRTACRKPVLLQEATAELRHAPHDILHSPRTTEYNCTTLPSMHYRTEVALLQYCQNLLRPDQQRPQP